jgi:phosphomevalonate decarboxylase
MKSTGTTTTVETRPDLRKDIFQIGGKAPDEKESSRILVVLDELRKRMDQKTHVKVESKNSDIKGKGLGYSASAFAALTVAAAHAFDLELSESELSETARLGAGSASRSVTGGFSIWYANNHGRSYSEMLAGPDEIKMKTIIVPVPSTVKTDSAHRDVLTSPFYRPRLRYVKNMLAKMKRAIRNRDVDQIGELAEIDTLNLHAITMTGTERMVLFSPLSIQIIEEVKNLRSEGVPCWYSLDTGPSVFVNTPANYARKVQRTIGSIGNAIISDPGGPAHMIRQHLF